MAKNFGTANFKSRAMRPGETDVPNPAAGAQRKLNLGSLGGAKSAGAVKGPSKLGQGVDIMKPPPKRGSKRGF